MRKLATIRKITNIRPIENADNLEVANIDGWNVVIKKGIHKENDLVLYIEVDSLLDENNPVFEFMRPRKFKIKTIKLRGVVSQGLVMPLSEISNIIDINKLELGDDVTKVLNIKKFEIDDDLEENNEQSKKQDFKKMTLLDKIKKVIGIKTASTKYGKNGFPAFIKKTDEPRYQNSKELILNLIKDGFRFDITEKLDGTSASYGVEKKHKKIFGISYETYYEFYICSRNLRISENDTTNKYVRMANKYNIKESLIDLARAGMYDTVYIQGEIIGQGIQKDKYKIGQELEFRMFNMVEDGKRLSTYLREIKRNIWFSNIKSVPILYKDYAFKNIEEIAEMSNMKSTLADTCAEGIVFRDREYLSFKAINPNFLLKNDL